jgi:hypothetical protein
MGKAGLTFSSIKKKYRPLGRWNLQILMSSPLLIIFLSSGIYMYSEPCFIYLEHQKTEKNIKSGLFIEN